MAGRAAQGGRRSADRAGRVVTIAAEAPGAEYFLVEPNGAQLASFPELRPEVDSVFPLEVPRSVRALRSAG